MTFDGYEKVVRCHLKAALGGLVLQDVRPEHVQHDYNEKMQHGLAAQTIGLHHVILSNVPARTEKNQLVARNVARLVDPRPTRKDRRTLTVDEVTTHLLPALTAHRLYAAFLTLFLMGLRRGELPGLRWQDMDLQAGVLHIRQAPVRVKNYEAGRTQLVFQEPKTEHSRRTIPLPDILPGRTAPP